METKIELQSDGLRLSGILQVPDDLEKGEKRAGHPPELYIVAGEDHFPLSGKDPKSPLIIKMWLDRFFPPRR